MPTYRVAIKYEIPGNGGGSYDVTFEVDAANKTLATAKAAVEFGRTRPDRAEITETSVEKQPDKPVRMLNRSDLVEFAREHGLRSDWHEPDEQGITATVHGDELDNAGFWGTQYGPNRELHIALRKDGQVIAYVNLATLLSWATGR